MAVRPAEDSFRRGLESFEKGRRMEALALFEASVELDRRFGAEPDPRHLSYYGLSLVLERRNVAQGVSLCRDAVTAEFFNPDLYCNLGRACLAAGRRGDAYQAFREGLLWERTHPGISRELKAMGRRRRPPFPFLSRGNPINRFLGRLSYAR